MPPVLDNLMKAPPGVTLPSGPMFDPGVGAATSALSFLFDQYNKQQPAFADVLPNFRSQPTQAEKADWYLRDSKQDRMAFAFLRAANNAFANDKVFDFNGRMMAPLDIAERIVRQQMGIEPDQPLSEEAANTLDQVRRKAVGELHDFNNEMVNNIHTAMLNIMQSRAVGGEDSQNAAISFRRAQQWEQDQAEGGPVASYRMSQGAKKNFAAQRTYDLFKTFGTGVHAPVRSQPMSKMMAAVGTAAYPFVGGALETMGMQDASDTNEVFGDTSNIAANSFYGGILGQAKNALYDYQRGQKGLDAGAIQDPISGAYFPDWSSTTQTGLGSKFNDSTNRYAQFARPFRDFVENNPFVATASEREALATAFNELQRPVMRVADPRSPAAMEQAYQAAEAQRNDIDVYNAEWMSSQYPLLVRSFNKTFGTNFTPTFLSPAADILANLPKEIVSDAYSFATLPLTAAANMAGKGMLRGLLQSGKAFARNVVDEVPFEAPPAAAQYMGDTGDGMEQLFKPQKQLYSIYDNNRQPVAADDPKYPFFREQARQRKQKGYDTLEEYVQNTDAERRRYLPQYNPWSGSSPPTKPQPRRPF